jgi:hypothetical protein
MNPGELTAQGMLCDFAEVSGNKLFISGAGISMIVTNRPSAPHPVNIALALMVRIPWTKTNQQHKLKVELISDSAETGTKPVVINTARTPDGKEEDAGAIVALFNAGRAPNMQVGEETLMPIAFPMPGLPLPDIGSYYFLISIDDTETDRVSFRIVSMLNMPGMSGPILGM